MTKVSDEYQYLYHYTDFKGLCGILESQCLWATHFQFLNDKSELQLFREELEKWLEPIVRKIYNEHYKTQKDAVNALLKKTNKTLEQAILDDTALHARLLCHSCGTNKNQGKDSPIFITSFSGESKSNEANQNEDGLLSQWRAYGGDGGYAIVFNCKALEDIFMAEGSKASIWGLLGSCLYSHQREKIADEFSENKIQIQSHLEAFLQCILTGNGFIHLPTASDAFTSVLSCMSRYKHQGFVEENEVRAAIFRAEDMEEGKPLKKIHFREGDGYQIPYIKLFEGPKLPIEKIIVGPHKEKEKRAAWLRIKLKSLGLSDIKVTVSDIPYI